MTTKWHLLSLLILTDGSNQTENSSFSNCCQYCRLLNYVKLVILTTPRLHVWHILIRQCTLHLFIFACEATLLTIQPPGTLSGSPPRCMVMEAVVFSHVSDKVKRGIERKCERWVQKYNCYICTVNQNLLIHKITLLMKTMKTRMRTSISYFDISYACGVSSI